MMRITALFCLSAGLLAPLDLASAQPITSQDRRLIERWSGLNSQCRGGSGDSSETWRACGRRDEVDAQLRARRLCYGRRGQAGAQMSWHRCARNSL